MQINQISSQSADFPELLHEFNGAPDHIFTLGNLPAGPYIAIVGTRNPSTYGRSTAYQIAGELAAAGFVIVSGLASGIDATAHQAAVDAHGKTVAVLGHGLDRIYPSSNRSLAVDILRNDGALVSEYPVGQGAFKGSFVNRNRIIAGLSLGVLIVEGNAKSGALHTVKYALDQGREVMAVPGSIQSELSAGPNNILRQGGHVVTGSIDIMALFADELVRKPVPPVRHLDERENTVRRLISQGNATTQQLIDSSGLSPSELADVMSLMEITGQLRNLGAGNWAVRTRA